jgi:hypothetical protein
MKILLNMKFFDIFLKYMKKVVGSGTGAENFDKLVPEPEQH